MQENHLIVFTVIQSEVLNAWTSFSSSETDNMFRSLVMFLKGWRMLQRLSGCPSSWAMEWLPDWESSYNCRVSVTDSREICVLPTFETNGLSSTLICERKSKFRKRAEKDCSVAFHQSLGIITDVHYRCLPAYLLGSHFSLSSWTNYRDHHCVFLQL